MLAALAAAALVAASPGAPPAPVAVSSLAGLSRCSSARARAGSKRREHAIRCLLNAERTARGLPRLHPNTPLGRAAREHSRDMVRRDFFDHTSPGGDTPAARARRAGYRSRYVGETIAYASGRASSAASTVAQWMGSTGHRAVILDGHMRDLGVGVASGAPTGGRRGTTVTADFGGR